MLQAKIISEGNIILEEIEIPEPEKGEVLVKVIYSGICGSDRHMMRDPSFFSYPVVCGHEIVGKVASAGKKLKEGQKVIVCPFVCCGECEFCKSGAYNLCKSLLFIGGTPQNGGFAEYITVDEGMLFEMPENMTDETAALVEPASVAYHCVRLLGPEKIGKVMVIGVGIIGLLSIKILKDHYNIKEITAVDISGKKLETASKNGADNIIDLSGKDWKSVEKLNDNPFLSGEYEGIIDYVSTSSSMGISIANLKKGGTMVATGLPPEDVVIEKLSYFAIANKELSIKGCYCYTKEDFGEVIDMLSKGKVKVEDLVSAKYELKDITNAFKDWEDNYSKWYKILIRP